MFVLCSHPLLFDALRMWMVILAILACLVLQDVQGANYAGADFKKNIIAISNICKDMECVDYVVKDKGEVSFQEYKPPSEGLNCIILDLKIRKGKAKSHTSFAHIQKTKYRLECMGKQLIYIYVIIYICIYIYIVDG